jgi:Uma2 family endonuclease
MSTGTLAKPLMPEELPTLPEADGYEFIDGRPVEKPMGMRSSSTGANLLTLLNVHCRANHLGWVCGADAGYQCFPNRPALVRKPDVSFVRAGRLPQEEPPEGYARLAPDLAVEVVSPQDLFYEIMDRVRDYLGVSTRLVWVIDPHTRVALIFRQDGSIGGVREDGALDGEDVVPGFRCPLGELFTPPVPPQTNGPA